VTVAEDRAVVVLGVCGGIAAYKAVEICRALVDRGLHVVPVLTEDATRFVGPLTFSALASEPVRTRLWDDPASAIPHTRLGQRADLVVVAPATADLIARYRAGLANDLLGATLLATRAPVLLAPAMHTEMWEHPSVRENLAVLRTRGVHVVPPAVGRLAGGDVGAGRLAPTEAVVHAATSILAGRTEVHDLAGRHFLVTAGGTREPIDPVRFVSNRSSGKQGHAVAERAVARGATVTLVTTSDRGVDPEVAPKVRIVPVDTAAEMDRAVRDELPSADVVVMAAAVADFRPKSPSPQKLARLGGPDTLALEPTPDILAAAVAARRPGQVVVGFAAETGDLEARARAKLERKGVDVLVANDVSVPGVGFDHDTNAVLILERTGHEPGGVVADVSLASKATVADAILDTVRAHLAPLPTAASPGGTP